MSNNLDDPRGTGGGPDPGGRPVATVRPLSWKGKAVFLVLIAGFMALAVGSFKYFFDHRAQTKKLVEEGIETEADVVSVTRTSAGARRGGTKIEIFVAYNPEGSATVEYGTVFPCTEVEFDPDADTIRVVYLPGEPEILRMAGCVTSVDSWIPPVVGVAFGALALVLVWLLARQWSG